MYSVPRDSIDHMTDMDAHVTEPALLIRIAKLYSPCLSPIELYEATRGVWRVGPRKGAVQFALSIARGLVVEVYEVGVWHPAGTTAYTTRSQSEVRLPGRWEFSGKVASPAIREKYLGMSVAHYFPRGAVNPIAYVNA